MLSLAREVLEAPLFPCASHLCWPDLQMCFAFILIAFPTLSTTFYRFRGRRRARSRAASQVDATTMATAIVMAIPRRRWIRIRRCTPKAPPCPLASAKSSMGRPRSSRNSWKETATKAQLAQTQRTTMGMQVSRGNAGFGEEIKRFYWYDMVKDLKNSLY